MRSDKIGNESVTLKKISEKLGGEKEKNSEEVNSLNNAL